VYFVAMIFIYSFLTARIVAETGLVFMGFYTEHVTDIMAMFPVSWVKTTTSWFGGASAVMASIPSEVCATTMSIHAFGLDQTGDATQCARRRNRLAVGFLAVLLLASVVAGASHLWTSYHYAKSLDGSDQPLNTWGLWKSWPGETMLTQHQNNKWNRPVYSRPFHIGFGAAFAGLLYWACLSMPRWPLHPAGLLIVFSFGEWLWPSVFVGWVCQVVVVYLGGARGYARARSFFIGIIMGDVFLHLIWAAVPAILHAFDLYP
jgi:ABC-type maltose transport system permease subunit